MILKKTLRELIDQKLKDADVLIVNRRYATAIYIVGYSIELALKLKICKIFKFVQGFRENKVEFGVYQMSVRSQKLLSGAITQIKDIRNHDLNKLLFYWVHPKFSQLLCEILCTYCAYVVKKKYLNHIES